MLRTLRIENLVLIREAALEFAPGLNAITGETGAGKTILAQAIGLLLGARPDASLVAPGAAESYVEAELDLAQELLDDEALEGIAALRPEGEELVALARRVGTDGRSRAFAWGRTSTREDLAAVGERLIGMSGQFEQRRLARPAYQLDVLDAFCGDDQLRLRSELRRAWRELAAARRRLDDLSRSAAATADRIAELRALAEDTEGIAADAELALGAERERLRHAEELAVAAATAAEALAPEDGDGALALVAAAARSRTPATSHAPELVPVAEELSDVELRLREAASDLRSFLAGLEADPDRLEQVESELDRLAALRRRFRASTTEELLARAAHAREELSALERDGDPRAAARTAVAAAEARVDELATRLHDVRADHAERLASAVADNLRDIGMGDGDFRVELRPRDGGVSATGADEIAFLIRPNQGLPYMPVAETASGGELSRIALAIAAVGGGATMVFDEIDAGIGGRTANAVGRLLRRLAERAQVITITHLPQIASVADAHFRVEKVAGDPTQARIARLEEGERRAEIERMLGGQEFLATVR